IWHVGILSFHEARVDAQVVRGKSSVAVYYTDFARMAGVGHSVQNHKSSESPCDVSIISNYGTFFAISDARSRREVTYPCGSVWSCGELSCSRRWRACT